VKRHGIIDGEVLGRSLGQFGFHFKGVDLPTWTYEMREDGRVITSASPDVNNGFTHLWGNGAYAFRVQTRLTVVDASIWQQRNQDVLIQNGRVIGARRDVSTGHANLPRAAAQKAFTLDRCERIVNSPVGHLPSGGHQSRVKAAQSVKSLIASQGWHHGLEEYRYSGFVIFVSFVANSYLYG
jgi:hypothetical protein